MEKNCETHEKLWWKQNKFAIIIIVYKNCDKSAKWESLKEYNWILVILNTHFSFCSMSPILTPSAALYRSLDSLKMYIKNQWKEKIWNKNLSFDVNRENAFGWLQSEIVMSCNVSAFCGWLTTKTNINHNFYALLMHSEGRNYLIQFVCICTLHTVVFCDQK